MERIARQNIETSMVDFQAISFLPIYICHYNSVVQFSYPSISSYSEPLSPLAPIPNEQLHPINHATISLYILPPTNGEMFIKNNGFFFLFSIIVFLFAPYNFFLALQKRFSKLSMNSIFPSNLRIYFS